MDAKTFLTLFEKHIQIAIKRLDKDKMVLAVDSNLCPFRCRWCKERKVNCDNCELVELKKTKEYLEVREFFLSFIMLKGEMISTILKEGGK